MFEADFNHTTTLRARRKARKSRQEFLDLASFPRFYGMRISGDCMEPDYPNGDVLVFDKEGPLQAGDDAIFIFRPEILVPGEIQSACKRLVTAIPNFVTFPWRDNPKSDVVPVIIAEQLNPPKRYVIACHKLLAVHRCIGLKSDVEARWRAEDEGSQL
jgi:hypothetical protein